MQYDARDFVLHLFARVCQAVVDELPRPRPGSRAKAGRLAVAAGLAGALAVSGVVTGFALPTRLNHDPALLRAIVLGALVAGLLGALLDSVAGPAVRGLRRAVRWVVGAPLPPDPMAVVAAEARRRLVQIRYLQTHTTGWSGKVALAGAESSLTRSTQLAGQSLTYPEIIDAFTGFLTTYVDRAPRNPAVVIAVDVRTAAYLEWRRPDSATVERLIAG